MAWTPGRFSNLGEGIFRDVFNLKNALAWSALRNHRPQLIEKFPDSKQTRRSRVFGEFWPILAAVWGQGQG